LATRSLYVMAGLDPAIHVRPRGSKDVDARVKPGHDDAEAARLYHTAGAVTP